MDVAVGKGVGRGAAFGLVTTLAHSAAYFTVLILRRTTGELCTAALGYFEGLGGGP